MTSHRPLKVLAAVAVVFGALTVFSGGQGLFGPADVGIHPFQHSQEEVVLVAEVVVDQALVHAGAFGNAVDPPPRETELRELFPRGDEDRLLRPVCVALADLGSRRGKGHN